MERALVILNPAAGAGRTARLWPSLADLFRHAGLAIDVATTSARGHAVEIARRAAADGWPLVVAVGGDGTVNEVVNGLADAAAPPALGVVATGRGRDVCPNLGVERDPRRAIARLATGQTSTVDLGLVEWDGGRRWFVTAAGAGFDAEVARRAQGRRERGTLPYVIGIAGAVRHHRPVAVTVKMDDSAWSGRATAVVVANGAWYGGGMQIAPGADPADGRLDVVVLGDVGRLQLLRWLPSLYRGTHVRHPDVAVTRCRSVVVDAATPLPVHVDGEPVATTPIRVEAKAAALRLVR